MASGIWVPGPAELHVGVGSGGALAFLGWSVQGFRVRLIPRWRDVKCDLSADVPIDVQRRGEEALIIGDLSVWDELVLQRCQSRGNPQTGTLGRMVAGEMGGLMVTEGAAYRVLLYSPYAAFKLSQTVLPQMNFVAGWMAGPDDRSPIGTEVSRFRAVFRAIPVYSGVDGSFTLWNQNVVGKPPAL